MRIALVSPGSKIENIIEVESLEIAAALFPGATLADASASPCGRGWIWNGATFAPPSPPTPTPAEIQTALVDAVQAHLDAIARTRNYDGILSLASYAASTVLQFHTEGLAGVVWRDACWAHCYQVMADVQAGLRNIPDPNELVAELPEMTWGI